MARYIVKQGEMYVTEEDTVSPNQKDAEVFDDALLFDEPGFAKYQATMVSLGVPCSRVVKLVPKKVKQ